MALLVFFAAFALSTATHAVGQTGFLSIDCGLERNYSGYKDNDNGLSYVSDGPYVDAGENHKLAAGQETDRVRTDLTVRSFPPGLLRNCYSLPTIAGTKYLVRVVSFYGNYDGTNSSSTLQFDLHLGANYWDTVRADGDQVYEAVFVAWASWAPVCLVNTGQGTPFVSSVELRPLGSDFYPTGMANQSMRMSARRSMGPTTSRVTSFPADQYDRYWWAMPSEATWANLSTTLAITEDSFQVSSAILQKAVTVAGNGTTLSVIWGGDQRMLRQFMAFLHFADFQDSQLREFDVYFNSDSPTRFTPLYLSGNVLYNTDWYNAANGVVNITLAATARSALPPMLNAFEIYTPIVHDTPVTFSKDFDAIMAIKHEYGVKKNWMGDPCFPNQYAWEGVKCRNTSDNVQRIISIDMSNSNLNGVVSSNFALLTALESLNLSGNQLNGPIPDSLCKNNGGQFILSYGSGGDICNKTINPSGSKNRNAIIATSVVAPVLAVAVLGLLYLIWRVKRKPNCAYALNLYAPLTDLKNSSASTENHLLDTENRRFTYEELQEVTNNFQRLIGRGGFGNVYYGRLENTSEVAVKIRSEYSKQGLHQFLAEVMNLTKVHHRNLVSLVGYCWEKDHLALVYEYMSGGNLCDHLRGKTGVGDTLNWATRLRIVLEAAQGLDYLHKGCNLPIIHRDVKTNNILLSQNLKAKLADFGLSKTYMSDTQTHISTENAAGTPGYMDPEYQLTGKLTESSDVYSFGIVLLEVATGEPPVLSDDDHTHITQHVKNNITSGNISLIADERLKDSYDVSSMWKVVDTAMMCTTYDASRRPTMSTVVIQLKECLALEEAHVDKDVSASSTHDDLHHIPSKVGPLAR
uniref:Protein kinase domain-containing protein n=1 Tax=Oryza brachyantha TaxID=4533 RepID=J3MWT6_ORYBR